MEGQHVPPWSGRRRDEALARVKAEGRRANSPCAICDLPIDYDLEYPHPASCSVQHVKAQSAFPHLRWDPSNWRPAHLDCNQSRGNRDARGIGTTSESFW